MTTQMSSLLFLVVGLSMAITPWLAAGGQLLASRFEQQDVRSLLPAENEVLPPLIFIFNAVIRTGVQVLEGSQDFDLCTVLGRLMIYKTISLYAGLVALGRYVKKCQFLSIVEE
jgi:hypothetical protein